MASKLWHDIVCSFVVHSSEERSAVSFSASVSMNDINILCMLRVCLFALLPVYVWVCGKLCVCWNTKWWKLWMNIKRWLTQTEFPDFPSAPHTQHTHTLVHTECCCSMCSHSVVPLNDGNMKTIFMHFIMILHPNMRRLIAMHIPFDVSSRKMVGNAGEARLSNPKHDDGIGLNVSVFNPQFTLKFNLHSIFSTILIIHTLNT